MRNTKIINALSFDVEDWYQVTVFDDVLKREDLASLESRLCESLEKIFAVLNECEVKATFLFPPQNLWVN